MSSWLIYGATGYTGQLIAREAVRQGLSPIVAGRNALAIETLGKQLGLPARVLLLDHPAAVAANLSDVALVLNCAGPFIRTAEPLLHACLSNHVHYLDISGEIATLERAQELDSQAVVAGIVICSGVGFDVIPTDCVAAMLKEALPEATELALGFESTQRLSPGTAKTMIEHLAEGGKVRRDGRIESVPFGYGVRRIDFGHGDGRAMAIPWGDVSTAFYTTGIPNITVYTRVTERQLWLAEILNAFRLLFRSRAIRRYAQRRIEARVKGPSQATRDAGRTWVWGEARDRDGVTKTVRLTAPDAYALTVSGAIGAVRRVLEHPITGGATTPARLLGSRYVLDLPGTALLPGSV